MTHIAIQEHIDGKVVDWQEHVSDEQYGTGAAGASATSPAPASAVPDVVVTDPVVRVAEPARAAECEAQMSSQPVHGSQWVELPIGINRQIGE